MRAVPRVRPLITRARCALATLVLLACPGREKVADSQRQSVDAATAGPISHYCVPRGAGPVRISEDSIGPLDLTAPLERLKALCPGSGDTVWYGGETASPAVFLPFDGLTVFAVQHQDSLVRDQPADGWEIRGTNGLLFGRLPLTASWVEFQSAFGPGIASGANVSTDEKSVTVMFCAHPRVFLVLEAPPESLTLGRRADLSRIPSVARIVQLAIYARPNPTWSC